MYIHVCVLCLFVCVERCSIGILSVYLCKLSQGLMTLLRKLLCLHASKSSDLGRVLTQRTMPIYTYALLSVFVLSHARSDDWLTETFMHALHMFESTL